MGKLVLIFWAISLTLPQLLRAGLAWNYDFRPEPRQPLNLPALIRQIDEADRLIVTERPRYYREPSAVYYQSTDRKDFEALKASLTVSLQLPDEWFHCMCEGTPAIGLYRGMHKIQTISNHHGRSIRCDIWSSDAAIYDEELWIRWFDDRGISSVRKEVEARRESEKASDRAWEKWQAAMPASLKPVWEQAFRDDIGVDINTSLLQSALAKEFPESRPRIRALLHLYGSGQGRWSGYPSYEAAVEKLLLEYATATLLDAIESAPLSNTEQEGAARLFAGWDFHRQRPNDRNLLPAKLKEQLWNHTKTTQDQDKLGRARRAFAP